MKPKSTELSQLKSRRHSGRLFNDSSRSQNNSKGDYASDAFIEHDSSSSSLSSLNNYSASATTSFLASSTQNEIATTDAPNSLTANNTVNSNHENKIKKKSTLNSLNSRNNSKASELFRTDFITAMKLGTDHLTEENCIRIADTWKMEWEKGVQVPNSKHLTKPNVCLNKNYSSLDDFEDEYEAEADLFSSEDTESCIAKMPVKLLCPVDDKNYNVEAHEGHLIQRISNIQNRKFTDCLISISKYEYDETDDIWLTKVNEEFSRAGLARLNHAKFEKIIENFENQSFEMLKNYLDKLCLYKIEYDPTVVCDVCRSPDSEPSNEIVFCDGCNVCVHQNCYGIEHIPEGNWLCAACEYGGPRPECCLCPNKGGALKPSKDHKQWCHVSCVLWTPEVTFGNPDKYEPVINLSKIPAEKWLHKCSLCKYRKGCCVECASARCSNSFHITCAFKHNLKTMETYNEQGLVEFSCLCKKHSKLRRNESASSPNASLLLNATQTGDAHDITLSEDISISEEKFNLALQSMNEADRKTEIIKRLEILYQKFYHKVSMEQTLSDLEMQAYADQIKWVYNYWKLKRRFNQQSNKPLISFRADKPLEFVNNDLSAGLSLKSSLFLDVRHRLEYLRNLCFIIKKREKKKEKYFELNRKYFNKLTEYLEKYKTPSSAPNKQKQASNISETWSSCRIRDMLQTKNENIIYDMPARWTLFDHHLKSLLNTSVPLQSAISFDQLESEQAINPSTSSINKSVLRARSKSNTSLSTNDSIKDISINVLNNNTNVEVNKPKTREKSINSNNDNNNGNGSDSNSSNVLSNCENNVEKRLLRSFSVYSDSSRKALEISLEPNEYLTTKSRLSLPMNRSSSVMGLNNSTKPTNNKLKSDSFNSNYDLKNPVKQSKDLKKTPNTTRKNKRPNPDSSATTLAKRPRYELEQQASSSPLLPPQTRFNLRTKIEK